MNALTRFSGISTNGIMLRVEPVSVSASSSINSGSRKKFRSILPAPS